MKLRNKFLTTLALTFSLFALNNASAEVHDLLVKSGDKIAFMGDSITAGGNKKNGYITLVMEALNKNVGSQLTVGEA